MKHFVFASIALGVLMTFIVAASATPGDTPQDVKARHVVGKGQATISGKNDKRIIRPDMSYYQRVMKQRDIKKRAAAMRNQLIQQARQQEQQQVVQP